MTLDLVMFGEDWGGWPSSTQHLARALLKGGDRILWVNSLGLRRPRWSDAARVMTKLRAGWRGRAAPRLLHGLQPQGIIAPLAPPVPRKGFEAALAGQLLARSLRRGLARTGLSARPILWTSLPTAGPVLDRLPTAATVYYCCDDFGALEGVDHADVLRHEAELAARVDLILATSPELAAKFPAAKTRLVPHGVDTDLFMTPQDRPPDVPQDRPTMGFYGSLAGWVDWDWLMALARLLPDWEIQLIGPAKAESAEKLAQLARYDNIRLLGPRAHGELPAYLHAWTAALLPFRDLPQIHACNPLKLREYLAAGVPTVATPFPAAQAYAPELKTAATVLEAAAYLRGLQERDPAEIRQERAARQQRVIGESWAARAATIRGYLEEMG